MQTMTVTEYSQTSAAISELRQKYEGVIFPVSTTAGMKDAKEARRQLRELRTGLEKLRKEIKAPALARCNAIDSEAKAITVQLVALEDPIDAQIKVEEARKEAEKAERERIERERVSAIRAKIDAIRQTPLSMQAESASKVELEIATLQGFTAGKEFAEFAAEANAAAQSAIEALSSMHARQVELEAAQARLAAEREEIERQRQEQAERNRIEQEERDAEERRLREERQALEAEKQKHKEELEIRPTSDVFAQSNSFPVSAMDIDFKPALTPPETTPTRFQLDEYDAGLLNGYGGGDVSWWHDYMRAELNRAYEFYQAQVDGLIVTLSSTAQETAA